MAQIKYWHLFYLKPEEDFLYFKNEFIENEKINYHKLHDYLDERLYICEVKRTNQKIVNMLRQAKKHSFFILSNIHDIFDCNFSDMEEIISILTIQQIHIRVVNPSYTRINLIDPIHVMLLESLLARISVSSVEWIEQQKKIQIEQAKEKQKQDKLDKFNAKQSLVAVKYSKFDRLIEKNKVFTDLDIQIMRKNRRASYSYASIAKKFNCSLETAKYFTKEIKVKHELVNIQVVTSLTKNDAIDKVLEVDSDINLVFRKYISRYTNIASRQPIYIRLLKYFEYLKAKNNNVIITRFEEVSTVNIVSDYLQHKRDQNTNDNQIRNIYLNLSSFFRYCFENEYIFENPIKKIVAPKIDSSVIRTKHLSTEELLRIVELVVWKYAEQSKTLQIRSLFKYMRNTIFMLIIIYTGMRISEVINLKKENIITDDGVVYIRTIGKNNKVVQRDIPDNLALIIKKYFELYKKNIADDRFMLTKKIESDERITINYAGNVVKYFVTTVGISKKISAHSFRTTFAMQSISNGMPIYELQRRMGHSNVNQTIAYSKTLESAAKNSYLSKSVLQAEDLLFKTLRNFDDIKENLNTPKKDIKFIRKTVFRKNSINQDTCS